MSEQQETLRLILERYRSGNAEAPYVVTLLEGLYAQLETGEEKQWLLNRLWEETETEFRDVTQGKTSFVWIFPVSVSLLMNTGNTSGVTQRLFRLLSLEGSEVGKMWAEHIGGQMAYQLSEHPERFADDTVARIEADIHALKFGAGTRLDAFRLDPDLERRLSRIVAIIADRRFKPIAKSLLEARQRNSADAKAGSEQGREWRPHTAVTRAYSDPIPSNLEELDDDIGYWTGRLGEGEPGSNHEYWVGTRLTKLQHARTRLFDKERRAGSDDRKFCALALEEARKSIEENDGRVHPKVGAVVVKDGSVLAVAHRGEIPGCHAEFIALEKKLANVPVAGATVYTTLEPCTSRNHPKIPCATRLVERRVGRVVIGMLDPNPEITGKGQMSLRKARVRTDFFAPELMDEVEDLNREFWRSHDMRASALTISQERIGSDDSASAKEGSVSNAGLDYKIRCCQQFGDEARQLLHDLAVDKRGCAVIIGDFWGSIDFGGRLLRSAGDRNIFVAKFDPKGNHIWSKQFGDESEKVGVGLSTDAEGNIFVLSAFTGILDFGGKPLVSRGRYNVALAKFDPEGRHLWSYCFRDDKYHAAECIAVTPSGQAVIAGRFQGSTDFGTGKIQSESQQTDIFLASFSPDGENLWAKRIGGPYEQQTRSIALDNKGNIALTGVFKGLIPFDGFTLAEQRPGDYCGFLAKFDERGNTLWCKRFGDPYVEQGGAVTFDPTSGDIIAAGAIRNKLPPSNNATTSVCLLVRYDSSGVLRWSKTFGTHAWPKTLAVSPDGRILFTGYFQGLVDVGLGGLVSAGGYDILAAVFSPDGTPQWSQRFGDRRQQFLVAGAHGTDGSIILAGSFHGTIDFGTGLLTASGYDGLSEGTEDVFLAIFDKT